MEKSVALIGANGMLAAAIKKHAPDDVLLHCYDLPEFDLTRREQVFSLTEAAPEIIINCAAYTNVDGCETHRELALQVNGAGPGLLAELAEKIGATLVHISTDFVFHGDQNRPYTESDRPDPQSVYGESKRLGEQHILQSRLQKYFIIRTSWLYGAGGNNFVETILRLAGERERLTIVADQRGTPTWTEDLARAIFALLQTDEYGLYHYSNSGECSWYEFASAIVEQAKLADLPLKVTEVAPIPTEAYPLPATRPKYSVLSKEKISAVDGIDIPRWPESLHNYFLHRMKGEKSGD